MSQITTAQVPREGTRQLILAARGWETAGRTLLVEPQRYAVGPVRWNVRADGVEWLVDDLEVVRQMPHGRDRFPLTDWIVLAERPVDGSAALSLLAEMELRASQTVIAVVFDPAHRGRWQGAVHQEGVIHPLDGVRIIGPRMLDLERSPESLPEISVDGRWSRTVGALGIDLWRKISTAHVLLIGCGRNGTQAAWQLAGLGVSRFTLVDGDDLKLANLDAMPGISAADVGQPKVTALAKRLIEFNPDLLIHGYPEPVTDVLDRLRNRYQLILTCVDSDVPRLAASWLSRELLVPQLDIGTAVRRTAGDLELAGDVRLLLPFEGCVDCCGGLADRAETLYEFAAPRGSLRRGEPRAWHQQRTGSLGHLNALTVAAGMEVWLNLLSGIHGAYWERWTKSAGGWRVAGQAVSAGTQCAACRRVDR